MDALLRDVRHAVRGLLRARAFTAVAVAVLAVGIGADAALFSIMNALLLRPPDGVREPARVAWLLQEKPDEPRRPFSVEEIRELGDKAQGFAAIGGMGHTQLSVGGDQPERVSALLVSGSWLPLLGTPMAAGRPLLPEDDRAGAAPAVVLSHRFWSRRFDAQPAAVGATLVLNGHAGVAFLLAAVALIASWAPARRAVRIDPMVALRSE